jgi:hypothetical protein
MTACVAFVRGLVAVNLPLAQLKDGARMRSRNRRLARKKKCVQRELLSFCRAQSKRQKLLQNDVARCLKQRTSRTDHSNQRCRKTVCSLAEHSQSTAQQAQQRLAKQAEAAKTTQPDRDNRTK